MPAPIHIDAGLGHVFRAVAAFGVQVGEELAAAGDLLVEVGVAVAVEQAGGVHDIGGAGHLDGRDGGVRSYRPADVEAHEHGFAAHNAAHVLLHVVMGFLAWFFFGQ